MFEELTVSALEKIVKNLDSESTANLAEAASCNQVLTSKLDNFKFNVCPFCILKRLSSPHGIITTTTGDEIFDPDEAFTTFVFKKQKLFHLENHEHLFKIVKLTDNILGTYSDEELNSYSFTQVLKEKSVVNAWKKVILSSKSFNDIDFEEHLLLHFIGAKGLKLQGHWSSKEMWRVIKDTAYQKDFIINPKLYRNEIYFQVGTVQDEFNRIVSSRYLWTDNIIATCLTDFKINLSKHLINKTLDLFNKIHLSSEPTDSFVHFYKQFTILKQIFHHI